MPNYELSESWARGSEYKAPFNYAVGKGKLTPEEAETWNPKDGQLVLCHKLDMGDLLKLGIAEQLDFMSKELITQPAKEGQATSEAVSNAIMKADNFAPMEKMVNLVVSAGVDEPRLHMPPADEKHQKRQLGLTYADSIPFLDRMELFSVCFDSEGLSTFRSEQAPGMGNVEHVESVQLPADGPVAELRPDDTERVLSQ
jgi:hypothetical protein